MDHEIARAVTALEAGGLVAFPTETVYGLGADATREDAVRRIFEAKGRPSNHPLIVHLASVDEIDDWASPFGADGRRLADAFWPGPLTLVLPRASGVIDAVTGGQATVGLRVPSHPVARALLAAFGRGIAAPSANAFGRVSATRAAHVHADLLPLVDVILDGGPADVGLESTIVDLSGAHPRLLRPGAIGADRVEAALGRSLAVPDADAPRVPGSLSAHYAPRVRLELVDEAELVERARAACTAGERVAILDEDSRPPLGVDRIALPREPEARARRLYDALRALDSGGYTLGLVSLHGAGGLADAIADRLARAARGSGG